MHTHASFHPDQTTSLKLLFTMPGNFLIISFTCQTAGQSNVTSYGKPSLTLLCAQLNILMTLLFFNSVPVLNTLCDYLFKICVFFQVAWEPLEGRDCAVPVIVFPVSNKMPGTEC